MAQNFAGAYGGDVSVPSINLNPLMNYIMKRQAAQEAKEDTLTKYFSTLTDKASSEGVRGQEQPAFFQSLKNAKDFYLQNKDSIVSGRNPEVAAKYQQLAAVPFTIAATSKGLLADSKAFSSVLVNPEVKSRVTDETLGVDPSTGQPLIDQTTGGYKGIYAHDQPAFIVNQDGSVGANPKFKKFDLSDMQMNPKEYNAQDLQGLMDKTTTGLNLDEVPAGTTVDPTNKLYNIETIVKQYSPEKLKVIGNNAAQQYQDPSLKYTFEKQHPLKNIQGEAMYNQANDIFKQVYGKDIENDQEFYTGMVMANKNQKTTETKKVLNPVAEKDLSLQYAKKLENYKKSLSPSDQIEYDRVSTPFEEIPSGPIAGTNLRIENGVVLDANNKPYTSPTGSFDVEIKKDRLPSSLLETYKKAGTDPILIPKVKATIVNGRIQAVNNTLGGLIGRDQLVSEALGSQGKKFPKMISGGQATQSAPTAPKRKKGVLN
jgi:hypothetical protein